MGRLLSTAATAAVLITGWLPGGLPEPVPAPSATDLPAATGSPAVVTEPGRTTEAICQDTAKIVVLGLQMFVGQMDRVSGQAQAGDLAGADLAVKDAGAGLAIVAGQLRRDAVTAEDPALRAAINEMAAEFDRLGASLSGLTALPSFDAAKLDAMATRMGVLCGPSPRPTAPVAPTETARRIPAPSPAGG
jgi:hypothetical protein